MTMPRHPAWLLEEEDVAVRRATGADAPGLRELATLDGARPLTGEVLVAEVGGELRAALSLEDLRLVADPFRPRPSLPRMSIGPATGKAATGTPLASASITTSPNVSVRLGKTKQSALR